MNEEKFEALILGGGPAGATAALLLARAGWHVAIVEKSAFPRRKVCGEFISATTLPLVRELGVAEAYSTLAGPEVRRVGLFEGAASLDAPMPRPRDGDGWGRALGREHLDSLLLNVAVKAGAALRQPWRATRIERTVTNWRCEIEGPGGTRQLFARLIIAATGSWERSPFFDPASADHQDGDLLGFKAHFGDCTLDPDLMPLLVFPGGYGGMVCSDSSRVSLSCCIRRDTLRDCRSSHAGRAGDAVLDHIKSSSDAVRRILANARVEGAVLSAGPIRPGIRPSSQPGGIFFIGNCAGEAHPIIAEGISMAMQSAWLLCRHLIARRGTLSSDPGLASIGNAYHRDWRRHFALRIHAAAAFSRLVFHPSSHAALRYIIKQQPWLLTLGARLSGKAHALPQGDLCLAEPRSRSLFTT
jgi:flavin-dependent dehydrogenase